MLELGGSSVSRLEGPIEADCFCGEVTRWSIPGIKGLAMRLSASVEVQRGRTIASLGMPAIGIPGSWKTEDEAYEIPSVWCLENAMVFGGEIVGRDSDTHWDGQLVATASGGLLPGSFAVMDGNRTLPRGLMRREGAGPSVAAPDRRPRRLEGTYVLLGSVHRHWGHMLLEGLTRLWIKEHLATDVKWLVYEANRRPFVHNLLNLAGIGASDVVSASEFDVVERLVVPDVGMRSHRWVTTAQVKSWDQIRRDSGSSRRRVFLSRRGVPFRRCRDELRIEDMFRTAGWEVVSPESMSPREQVIMAGEVGRFAGFVGSQMYLAAFQPDYGSNIIIAPENFFLRDDLLIGAARAHQVDVIFGSSVDASDPVRAWSVSDSELSRLRSVL